MDLAESDTRYDVEMSTLRQGLRQWLLCFVVCNFNVDVGPEIEAVYPLETPFSQADLSTICFNSFPERHDSEWTDDMYFTFTMRNNSDDIRLMSPAPPYGSPNMFFGVSVFRQEHDSMMKRSYNQKSLVVMSNHEFPALFMNMLRVLTADGLIFNLASLEAACAQIQSWPAPKVGPQALPFLGIIFNVDIPPYPSFPLPGLSGSPSSCSGLVNEMAASEPLEHWSVLIQLLPSPSALYLLYERALLGQSIIVLGANPQHVSAVVHAIIDLIRPIPFTGIVRPYLPMQSVEQDSKLFDPSSHGTDSPISMLVGITNPFLLQRVSQSPNPPYILVLASQAPPPPSPPLDATPPAAPARTASLSRRATHRVTSLTTSILSSSPSPQNSGPALTRIGVPGAPASGQPRPARFIRSDRRFPPVDVPVGAEGSTLVRKHFAHLTARILAPVNRSLATGHREARRREEAELPRIETPMVVIASRAGKRAVPGPTGFPVEMFVAALPRDEAEVVFAGQTGRGRVRAREEFYSLFLRSGNFAAWLEDVAGWVVKKAEAGALG